MSGRKKSRMSDATTRQLTRRGSRLAFEATAPPAGQRLVGSRPALGTLEQPAGGSEACAALTPGGPGRALGRER